MYARRRVASAGILIIHSSRGDRSEVGKTRVKHEHARKALLGCASDSRHHHCMGDSFVNGGVLAGVDTEKFMCVRGLSSVEIKIHFPYASRISH